MSRAWIASSTPSSRDSIWNGNPAPSPYLHKQLDVTLDMVSSPMVSMSCNVISTTPAYFAQNSCKNCKTRHSLVAAYIVGPQLRKCRRIRYADLRVSDHIPDRGNRRIFAKPA